VQIEHLPHELVIIDDTQSILSLLKLLGESQNRDKASEEKWMETSPNERQSSAIQAPGFIGACYRPGQI